MHDKRPCRVLMVDDDRSLGELLAGYLGRFGHHLSVAGTAAEGRERLRRETPDLLILDVMLPDADGMALCREIRAGSDLPILMLTARGDLPDRVLGLELGADDYLSKPFEPRELVARIETLVRRARSRPGGGLHAAGGLTLEPETRRVTLDGEPLDLTTAEFELLRALMESAGRVLSRDALLDRLRGVDAEAIFDRSIDMAISRLRRKLGDDSRTPRFIGTVRGAGYQFLGALER